MTYDRVVPRSRLWNNDRKYFYKYLSLDTAKLVIEKQTLRFSRPELLNDPYDMGFDLSPTFEAELLKPKIIDALWLANFGDSPPEPGNALGLLIAAFRGHMPRLSRDQFEEEFRETIDESLANMRNLDNFNEEIRKFLATNKVLCLTETPDNILMWAHYAESHKGIVLRLRSIPENDSIFGIAKPVQYVDKLPDLMSEDKIIALLSGSGRVSETVMMEKLIYTKSADWKYEREWRISAGDGWNKSDPFEDIKFGREELDGIIFGARTPHHERLSIMELARAQSSAISFFEAKRSLSAFSFEIIDFDAG